MTVTEQEAYSIVKKIKEVVLDKGHFSVEFKHKGERLDLVILTVTLKIGNNNQK